MFFAVCTHREISHIRPDFSQSKTATPLESETIFPPESLAAAMCRTLRRAFATAFSALLIEIISSLARLF